MRLSTKTVVAVSLAVLGTVAAYFILTPFALSGVQVTTGICEEPADTSVRGTWSGQTYQLTVDQAENCGVDLRTASVQRIGSHLFVRTKFWSPSGMHTSCYCQHQTTLRIPGLPRQAFQAHVYSWP